MKVGKILFRVTLVAYNCKELEGDSYRFEEYGHITLWLPCNLLVTRHIPANSINYREKQWHSKFSSSSPEKSLRRFARLCIAWTLFSSILRALSYSFCAAIEKCQSQDYIIIYEKGTLRHWYLWQDHLIRGIEGLQGCIVRLHGLDQQQELCFQAISLKCRGQFTKQSDKGQPD